MKIYTILLISILTLSACAQNASSNETSESTSKKANSASVHSLSQADFKATFEGMEGLQLLDVRTPQEIAGGKIGNAKELNVMDPSFVEKINSLEFDKTKPVVIYCKSGGRSSKASQIFLDQGFEKVYNLVGGYSNY